MNIAASIVVVLIMLGVLATLHELGHYWMARLLKIKVFEVSIFVGPKLLKWKHKEVDFSLRMIPIGAYVRFSEIDEEGKAVDSKDPDLLLNQPRIKRLLVAFAGPAMNLCLGILIFLVMFWVTGFTTTHITKPEKGSQLAAYAEMVNDGDTIKAVNGVNVYSSFDLVFEMDSADPSKEMDLKIKSKETGKNYTVTLTPVVRARPMLLITVENKLANNDYKGWKVYSVSRFFSALGYAAKMPASIFNISIRGIKDIIAGKVKAYNLVSGPIGITTMVNDVVADEQDTFADKAYILVMLSAVISIALAFSNLLPIPGLDGIQIIFIAVEMVIGRKLSEKAEARLTVVGFVIIVLLIILAFVSDILRIIFGY